MISLSWTPSADLLVFIGARAGHRPSYDETVTIINRGTNQRNDTILASCTEGWGWLKQVDIDWHLRYCSGVLYLPLNTLTALLTTRTEWSRK